MKNIIWRDTEARYVVTHLIGEVDSLSERDKIVSNGESVGLTFIGTDYNQSEIDELLVDQNLQEAKALKLAELDKNRNDFCLVPIEYQGNTYATTLNGWAAITRLENRLVTPSSTADYPNYPQGVNVTLTKADFTNIGDLIQVREMESRNRRKLILDQIEAINTDEQYFDENDQEITALEALNAIDITF